MQVHAGGLRSYAQVLEAHQKELKEKLKACYQTVNEPISGQEKRLTFPRLANFFYNCQRLDRFDKLDKEVEDLIYVGNTRVKLRQAR